MKSWVKKILEAREFKLHDGFDYWRERVFRSIILIITIVGLPAYISGVYMSIIHEVYIVAVIDTVVYAALIYLLLFDKIRLKYKVYTLISLPLVIGCSLVIILGPQGAGFSYFIGFVILASILLGIKGAIGSLIIHISFTITVALGIYFKLFGDLPVNNYTTMGWITIAINSFVICSITSIPLSVLIKGLNDYITKHRHLEKVLNDKITQLNKAKVEAEKANMLKTKFLANMSHEVRTPLNVIMGFSEIVQQGMYEDARERSQFLKTINQNGHYLLNIIENILDISMIESGQFKYNISLVNVYDLMEELKHVYQVNNNPLVQIVFNESSTINKKLFINTDKTRLKQVLINLINNALKYTNEGEIRINYEQINGDIGFSVKDTGVGINPENLDHIFDRFVKIEGEDEVKDGTGLGLAISKSIIHSLGGSIRVESTVNVGSTFFVQIPITSQIK